MECCDPSGLFWRKSRDLREAAVHRLDTVLRIEQHHAFLQPLHKMEELRLGAVPTKCSVGRRQRLERDRRESAVRLDALQPYATSTPQFQWVIAQQRPSAAAQPHDGTAAVNEYRGSIAGLQ